MRRPAARPGRNGLTSAAQIGGPVTGTVDATGCDIGVYNPDSVTNADISGALWYGVVANGVTVNVTGSKVHDIGDIPFNGVQRGRAIAYINGASGKISGNQVSNFQKNGIEVHALSTATIEKNVIKGRGSIDDIAQNGIVIRDGGSATVKNNTISGFFYTPGTNEATGILLWYNEAGTFAASANKFAGNEVNIYTTTTEGALGAPGGHVKP